MCIFVYKKSTRLIYILNFLLFLFQITSIEQEIHSLIRLRHKNLIHYLAIKYIQEAGKCTVYVSKYFYKNVFHLIKRGEIKILAIVLRKIVLNSMPLMYDSCM